MQGEIVYMKRKAKRVLKYSTIGASYSGITMHPSEDLERLGIEHFGWEAMPIADCIMIAVPDIEYDLPEYIEECEYDMIVEVNEFELRIG